MTAKTVKTTYQLKITLINSKPPIWRRVLVPSSYHLGLVHKVIQIAMGWTNSHLHQFVANQTFYSPPEYGDMDMDMDSKNETKYKLSQLLKKEKDKLVYEYDFGDGWSHKIELEKILPYDYKAALPFCVTGKRACPPEDCGGVWGYEDLIKAITDPNDPEHEDMLEWLGGEFDPEFFDIEEVNEILEDEF